MQTRVLVTGGAGFIGYHLATALLQAGVRVALLDNFNAFYPPELKRRNVADLGPEVLLFEADLLDTGRLADAFATFAPEAVVHLGAWAGVRPSIENPGIYADVNVRGTINVLEAMRAAGCPTLVFASSSSVYGDTARIPFAEDDPVATPLSPYAATKRAGELLAYTYSHNHGLRATCLRLFTVYGPRQRPEMAIHKFARNIWDGDELPLYGDGSSRRDYTYVADVVSGILGALERDLRFEILNVGNSRTISLLELVGELESALGRRARVRFLPAQPGDVPITYADIGRARQALGFEPRTPLKEGLARFAAWFIAERAAR